MCSSFDCGVLLNGHHANAGQAYAVPRRRKGSGPLGLEIRFMWGDQMLESHFIHPEDTRAIKVGSGEVPRSRSSIHEGLSTRFFGSVSLTGISRQKTLGAEFPASGPDRRTLRLSRRRRILGAFQTPQG